MWSRRWVTVLIPTWILSSRSSFQSWWWVELCHEPSLSPPNPWLPPHPHRTWRIERFPRWIWMWSTYGWTLTISGKKTSLDHHVFMAPPYYYYCHCSVCYHLKVTSGWLAGWMRVESLLKAQSQCALYILFSLHLLLLLDTIICIESDQPAAKELRFKMRCCPHCTKCDIESKCWFIWPSDDWWWDELLMLLWMALERELRGHETKLTARN